MTDAGTSIGALVRALRHRDYRLYFAGQGISLLGTWMQKLAVNWLVYRITGSAFMLGLVHFAGLIPTFFFAPWAGVVVDRLDRRRLLLVTQTLAMIQALGLALVAGEAPGMGALLALSAALGFVNAIDIPARQSLVAEIVKDRADLGNAIALNSFMLNGARLVGPSVAGIIIALWGERVCFAANGLSFVAVIGCLAAMSPLPPRSRAGREPVLAGLRAGLAYAARSVPLAHLLLLIAAVSTMGVSYSLLLPVIAKDVLGGGPHTLGFLTAATGVGALFGAVYLASRKNVVGLFGIVAAAAFFFGASLIAFSFSTNFHVSMAILVGTGFTMMVHLAGSNTLLQTITDDDKRGRIMGLYTAAFMGMTPFGNLLDGQLATMIGPAPTLLLCGGVLSGAALIFALRLGTIRRAVAPIYVQRGIIREHEPEARFL